MLGAGMMGAGIATVAAQAGMEVVLVDRDQAYAEKGKAHVEEVLTKRLGKGLTPEKMVETRARGTPTTHYAARAGAAFVIQAVFEDVGIKAEAVGRTPCRGKRVSARRS